MRRPRRCVLSRHRVFRSLSLSLALLMVPALARAQPVPAAVRAHVIAGQDRDALALLARSDVHGSLVSYLRGRLLERVGDDGGAADAYAGVGRDAPTSLRQGANRRRAFALARAGRCEEGRRALEGYSRGRGSTAALARAERAHCLLILGRHREAMAALEDVVEEDAGAVDHFAALFWYAEAARRAGDRGAARRSLRRALIRRPAHPDAEAARLALTAIDGRPPTFSAAEQVEQARALARAGRFARAIEALAAAGDAFPNAARTRADWLFDARRYDEARDAFRALVRRGRDDDAAYFMARSMSRGGDDRGAATEYARFADAHPTHRRAKTARYLAAWLTYRVDRRRGRTELLRYLRLPARRRRTNDTRRVRWLLGFDAAREGRRAEAHRHLDAYLEGASDQMERLRVLYWRAKADLRGGRRSDGVRGMRALIDEAPLHWYAIMARRELETAGVSVRFAFPLPTPGPELALPPTEIPADIRALDALGLVRDARDAFVAHARSLRDGAPRGRRQETLVRAYAAIGDTHRAFRAAAFPLRAFRAAPGPANRWRWESAYPTPHRPTVEAAAERHGLPLGYVYGTMRQESAYREAVVSPAGAVGVLQLMPATAARRARAIGIAHHASQLSDGGHNIRLGTAEMAALRARFDGAIPLVIAAYNAGAHRVDSWLAASGEIPLDEFVEQIPYGETRNYVRRVTSHWAAYRAVYALGDPYDLDLPVTVGASD